MASFKIAAGFGVFLTSACVAYWYGGDVFRAPSQEQHIVDVLSSTAVTQHDSHYSIGSASVPEHSSLSAAVLPSSSGAPNLSLSVVNAENQEILWDNVPPYENVVYATPVVDASVEPTQFDGAFADWDHPADKYSSRTSYVDPDPSPYLHEKAEFTGVVGAGLEERYGDRVWDMPDASAGLNISGPELPPYDNANYVAPDPSYTLD